MCYRSIYLFNKLFNKLIGSVDLFIALFERLSLEQFWRMLLIKKYPWFIISHILGNIGNTFHLNLEQQPAYSPVPTETKCFQGTKFTPARRSMPPKTLNDFKKFKNISKN